MHPSQNKCSSFNFAVSNTPYRVFTGSFHNPKALFTNKRRRHGQTLACIESPRRASTSLSISNNGSPKSGLPDQSSSQYNGSATERKRMNEELPRDTRLGSNGTPEYSTPDGSSDQNLSNSSHLSRTSKNAFPIALGPLSFYIPARWLLYSVPFLWGSFGPSVRVLFAQQPHQDPSVFNTERLLLSTLVYLPVLASEFQAFLERKQDQTRNAEESPFAFFPAGIELGVYVFLANVAQVIGLQQTSASRAAFLVQLQTVIVPVLSGIFGIDQISAKTWISSAVAVAGVALLSSDKGHGTVASLSGDALEILSALFFSTYIIRLGKYCNRLPANPLVATKIATQAVLSIGWAFAAELGNLLNHAPTHVSSEANQAAWTLGTIAINVGVVAWTGLMSSAASGWAQTKGQQGVPASEAVVIFATQPLWASALAALLLGESFGPRGLAGGALIVAATLLASKNREKSSSDT